jgi:hypothetical protein
MKSKPVDYLKALEVFEKYFAKTNSMLSDDEENMRQQGFDLTKQIINMLQGRDIREVMMTLTQILTIVQYASPPTNNGNTIKPMDLLAKGVPIYGILFKEEESEEEDNKGLVH